MGAGGWAGAGGPPSPLTCLAGTVPPGGSSKALFREKNVGKPLFAPSAGAPVGPLPNPIPFGGGGGSKTETTVGASSRPPLLWGKPKRREKKEPVPLYLTARSVGGGLKRLDIHRPGRVPARWVAGDHGGGKDPGAPPPDPPRLFQRSPPPPRPPFSGHGCVSPTEDLPDGHVATGKTPSNLAAGRE